MMISLLFFGGYLATCSRDNIMILPADKALNDADRKLKNEAMQFSKLFIKGYRLALNKKIDKRFQDNFLFANGNIYINIIISAVDEMAIEYFPDSTNKYSIIYTQLPVEIKLLTGIYYDDKELKITDANDNNVPSYDFAYAFRNINYGLKGGFIWASEINLVRAFDLFPNNILVAGYNTKLISPFCKGEKPYRISYRQHGKDDVIFWLNSPHSINRGFGEYIIGNFAIFLGKADPTIYKSEIALIVDGLIDYEFSNLLARSDLFRQALADSTLEPLANDIAGKINKANNREGEYPSWERELDYNKLCDLAIKRKIISSDYPRLLVDRKVKEAELISGKLIWFFDSQFAFSIQWAFINMFIAIFSMIVYITMGNTKFINENNARKILFGLFSTIMIGANGWVINKIPKGVAWYCWPLPVTIFVAIFMINIYMWIYLKNDRKAIFGNKKGT